MWPYVHMVHKTFYSLVSFSADEIQGETVMESNPSGYVMFDAEYGSIQDETIQTGKTGYSWLIQAMHGGLIHDGFGFMWNAYDASPAFGISISGTEKSETEFLFNHGRMMGESYNATLGGTAYCRIISLPFTLSEGKLRYHGHLSEEHLSNTMLMAPQGGVDFFLRKNLVSHPRFSYDVEPESGTVTGLLGNNVPVLVTGTVWMPRLSGFSGMDLFYYGRYGEYRECDLYSGWVEVVSEGEKVLEGNIQEFLTWSAKEFALPKPGGRYTFTIENDNALVDGKPGLNRTVINCDASLSDREAPTLTMLNFRNSSDEITDRFTDASDCTLEFSAADLGSQRNDFGNGWYSVASPASVKVEYAAEGSDDFRELEVNEVPELYFEPGFGSFYRVPFKNAGMRSSTGWFQLRITVTDEAGNSQQQTIAPALYIESLAGVEDISYSSRLIREGNQFMGDGKIRIYDLTGRIVRTGEFSISTDGLSGAYIVSCNGEIVKIII